MVANCSGYTALLSGDEAALLDSIVQVGPISVGFDARDVAFIVNN